LRFSPPLNDFCFSKEEPSFSLCNIYAKIELSLSIYKSTIYE
jgi:hypothetical protein